MATTVSRAPRSSIGRPGSATGRLGADRLARIAARDRDHLHADEPAEVAGEVLDIDRERGAGEPAAERPGPRRAELLGPPRGEGTD